MRGSRCVQSIVCAILMSAGGGCDAGSSATGGDAGAGGDQGGTNAVVDLGGATDSGSDLAQPPLDPCRTGVALRESAASPEAWNGPFASWKIVKLYRAVGDGKAHDT